MTRETTSFTSAPLQGIRVADFTWLWAGAYSTGLLALLGAEVIKIESMSRADPTRSMTFTLGTAFEGLEESFAFNSINLNKLSVKLNLKRPEAVELAKRIVRISDVAASNMRPGAMASLGLSYDDLKEIKPDIVALSSSAFGSDGPFRSYGGYAPGFACGSGLANVTGYADATPNPMTGSTDLLAAVTGAFSIVAALNHRRQTGRGQHIDASSVECQAVLAGDALMEYLVNGRVQTRQGNQDKIMAPHNCYRSRGDDKWVSIAVSTPEEWAALCDVLGNPAWTQDDRFADAYRRWNNRDELDALVTSWTVEHMHREATEMLQKAGVAAMPSLSNEELSSDPQFEHRGMATTVDHPVMGEQAVFGLPWRFSKSFAPVKKASPIMGESNDYVFGELLGLSADEIQHLMDEGIIY
jgi:benzylsuccinate CoA-transferase BbsF subunit